MTPPSHLRAGESEPDCEHAQVPRAILSVRFSSSYTRLAPAGRVLLCLATQPLRHNTTRQRPMEAGGVRLQSSVFDRLYDSFVGQSQLHRHPLRLPGTVDVDEPDGTIRTRHATRSASAGRVFLCVSGSMEGY